jgi:hypothetical protein
MYCCWTSQKRPFLSQANQHSLFHNHKKLVLCRILQKSRWRIFTAGGFMTFSAPKWNNYDRPNPCFLLPENLKELESRK